MGGKSLKLLEGFTEGSLKSASGQCQTRRGGGGKGNTKIINSYEMGSLK